MPDSIPRIIVPPPHRDAIRWLNDDPDFVRRVLDACGAVLLRGFDVKDENQFKLFVKAFSGGALDYLYRSSPRTHLGDGVYTATEYPAGLTIALHNENAFQREWPMHLLFFCMKPATGGGGETPLAVTTNVTKRIDLRIRETFMRKRVMYIRNFNNSNIDLSWQTAFQTESKMDVEVYCRKHHIDFEWMPDNGLRTKQVRPALVKHPRTGAMLWFNQVHAFHPHGLDSRSRRLLFEVFDRDNLPRNVTYGDGAPIGDAEVEAIAAAFCAERITFPWQAGDILIVDNMLISHGRNAYQGDRRVLVAMSHPYSS
jgi:alpha-ketoglutarate-dependent taurine dioxygenase